MYDIIDLSTDCILYSELTHDMALEIFSGLANQDQFVIVRSL